MANRTVFLGKLIGLFMLFTTLTIYANTRAWLAAVTALVHAPPVLLMVGMMALVAGLAIVLSHNMWKGGVLPVLVTLFGWVLTVRGLIALTVPSDTLARLLEDLRLDDFIRVYAIGALGIGVLLTYLGFTAKTGEKSKE